MRKDGKAIVRCDPAKYGHDSLIGSSAVYAHRISVDTKGPILFSSPMILTKSLEMRFEVNWTRVTHIVIVHPTSDNFVGKLKDLVRVLEVWYDFANCFSSYECFS
jgi:hypothetical protein